MEKRSLGSLEVSPVGMGCMGFSHGYGKIPDEQYSIEAIREGYDFGCTFFDTAEAYAPNLDVTQRGHNERIVGKALKDIRKNVIIATKLHLGSNEPETDGSVYAAVKRHLLASMERLQTDYVDLYYWHRVNPAIDLEEVAGVFGELIKEGLIRGWGLSQVTVETISKAHAVTPLSAVQNIYSMVERGIEDEVIPFCKQNNIGIVPFSPVASGLLSGKVTADTKFEKVDDVRNLVPQLSRENLIANQPLVDMLKTFAQEKGATPAQISLAWMLRKHTNVVPIPGSKNKERIIENLGSWNVMLSESEFEQLERQLENCEVHGHRGFDEAEGRSFLSRK